MTFHFRELNYQKFARAHEGQMDVCVFNCFEPSFEETVDSLLEVLDVQKYEFKLTVLDVVGFFKEGKRVSKFILDYPEVKIFIPAQKTSLSEVLNTYIKESKSNYVLTLSSDLKLSRFSMEKIVEVFQTDQRVMGVLPEVIWETKEVPSIYKLTDLKSGPYVFFENHKKNRRSLVPYQFSFFFDRDLYLSVSGLDHDFHDFFNECLDFGYRLYQQGHVLQVSDGFKVTRLTQGRDFHANLKKGVHALEFFKLKNIAFPRPGFFLWKKIIHSLCKAHFFELKQALRFYKKRQQQSSMRVLSDEEVIELVSEDT